MEHAIRHHISVHVDEDPTRYRRLSERLEQILEEHRDNWEQQAFALSEFLDKSNGDFPERPVVTLPGPAVWSPRCTACSRRKPRPTAIMGQEQAGRLAGFSHKLNSLAFARTKKRDFWRHPADQADFTKEITVALITDDVCQPEQAPALADKLTEIIRANKAYLQSQD